MIILINVYLIKLLSAVNQWQEPFHRLHKHSKIKVSLSDCCIVSIGPISSPREKKKSKSNL